MTRIKKLISILGVLTISVSSTITVVSCGRKIDQTEWNNPADKYHYRLFGKEFDSKQEAVDYFLYNEESGVKWSKHQDVYNQILLGENKFNNLTEAFEYINRTYKINETSTNKNVDKYIMDSLGQLYPEVISDQNDETIVYKDANGNAISEKNEELAKNEVNKSYTDKIEKQYISNGKKFEYKFDIEEYYYSNFLSNNTIPSETLYKYGNLAYTEEGLKQKIEGSIELEYTTKNGDTFLDSQVNDLSVINLTESDKSQINKVHNSPGLYNIEQIDENEGIYTGDSIIESNADIQEIILNKNNWELISSEKTSVKEKLFSSISSLIANLVEQLWFVVNFNSASASDMTVLESRFGNYNDLTINSIFNGFDLENRGVEFKNLVNKYGLIAESNASVNSLKNIKSIDFSNLSSIYLYQMKEAFKFTNITSEDVLKLNEIYFDFFLKYDSRTEWKEFVEKIGSSQATYITDFLVNKSQFEKFCQGRVDSSEIKNFVKNLADKSIAFAEKVFSKLIDDIMSKLKDNEWVFKKYVTKILELSVKAQKALIFVAIVIKILDLILYSTTKIYQLTILDTHQKLEYQMTNFILSSKTFDPAKVFRVTELKKPIKEDMYLYNERYFPTYDYAIMELKRNIIQDTIKNGKKIYFSSNNIEFRNSDKDSVINDLLNYYMSGSKIDKKYTDFFGGEFDNEQQALQSMLEKLEKEEFQVFYKYLVGTNEFRYFDTYEKAENYVLSTIEYENKKVAFSELVEGKNNYQDLYDLDYSQTTIYYFDFQGIKYYFKDKTNLVYYIMKLLNFNNNLVEVEVEQFWLNDIFFSNKVSYIDYLDSNLVEVDDYNTGRKI